MTDLSAVFHWTPAATDDLDWLELLAWRAELPRVMGALKGG